MEVIEQQRQRLLLGDRGDQVVQRRSPSARGLAVVVHGSAHAKGGRERRVERRQLARAGRIDPHRTRLLRERPRQLGRQAEGNLSLAGIGPDHEGDGRPRGASGRHRREQTTFADSGHASENDGVRLALPGALPGARDGGEGLFPSGEVHRPHGARVDRVGLGLVATGAGDQRFGRCRLVGAEVGEAQLQSLGRPSRGGAIADRQIGLGGDPVGVGHATRDDGEALQQRPGRGVPPAAGEFGQRRLDPLPQHLLQALAFARRPVLELVSAGHAQAGQKLAVVRQECRFHIAALYRVGELLMIAGELRRQLGDRIVAGGDHVAQGAPQSPERLSHILPEPLHRRVTPQQLRDSVA